MDVDQKAWLVMCVGDGREHGGNDGYADLPESSYLWDSTVGNYGKVKRGDKIVLRNKKVLLGVSVIEHIEKAETTKPTYKCPACDKGDISLRKRLLPRYRCDSPGCKQLFDTPIIVQKDVMTYRSHHHMGWVDLRGRLDGKQLNDLCIEKNPRVSLRELRWEEFQRAIGNDLAAECLRPLDDTAARIAGGHKDRTVRGRIGQKEFRDQLLEQAKNPVCAFTGQAPVCVLDAGHLYSYAIEGEHHPDGGLLIRRDVHTLFDAGLIAVNPSTGRIDVSPQIRGYSAYGPLHGQPLQAPLKPRQQKWLELHWAQHRADATGAV